MYCVAGGLGVEIYAEPQPRATKSGNQQFTELYNFFRNKNIAMRSIWLKVKLSNHSILLETLIK